MGRTGTEMYLFLVCVEGRAEWNEADAAGSVTCGGRYRRGRGGGWVSTDKWGDGGVDGKRTASALPWTMRSCRPEKRVRGQTVGRQATREKEGRGTNRKVDRPVCRRSLGQQSLSTEQHRAENAELFHLDAEQQSQPQHNQSESRGGWLSGQPTHTSRLRAKCILLVLLDLHWVPRQLRRLDGRGDVSVRKDGPD